VRYTPAIAYFFARYRISKDAVSYTSITSSSLGRSLDDKTPSLNFRCSCPGKVNSAKGWTRCAGDRPTWHLAHLPPYGSQSAKTPTASSRSSEVAPELARPRQTRNLRPPCLGHARYRLLLTFDGHLDASFFELNSTAQILPKGAIRKTGPRLQRNRSLKETGRAQVPRLISNTQL
jgi:hypothetical protein